MVRNVDRRQAMRTNPLPLYLPDKLLFILKNPDKIPPPLGSALRDPRVNTSLRVAGTPVIAPVLLPDNDLFPCLSLLLECMFL